MWGGDDFDQYEWEDAEADVTQGHGYGWIVGLIAAFLLAYLICGR